MAAVLLLLSRTKSRVNKSGTADEPIPEQTDLGRS